MPVIPFIPLIAGAASGIGAGLSAGRGKKVSVSQNYDPTSAGMRSQLATLLSGKLNQPLSLDPNLLAQALGGVNKAYGSGVNSLQNQFSSRGLGQSGIFGGSLSNLDLARRGKISDILNQLAGTATDRQNTTIAQALQLASPTGQTTSQAGSVLGGIGGGLGDLGTTLGLLSALGMFSNQGQKGTGLGLEAVNDPLAGVSLGGM